MSGSADPPSLEPYHPIDVLKPVDRDLWIVDGPVVRMRYIVGHLPFSTRMTIVRLPGRQLWVHSPTELTAGLAAEVAALGSVAFLVAPNRLHWVWLADWQGAFPDAVTHVAPGVEKMATKGGFRIDDVLAEAPPPAWDEAIGQVLVPGGFMTEAVFFHYPSATLIVTDLVENFERSHVHSRLLMLLLRIGGVVHPYGTTPRDLRLTFLGKRAAVRRAVEVMIAWAPRRIILAHGRCIETGGTAELRRALDWTGAGRT